MYRFSLTLLVLILLMLQYRLWVGEGGLSSVYRVQDEIEAQHDENQRLSTRNAQYEAEIENLKVGVDATEGRARENLGMIKEGEDFYLVVEPKERDGTASDSRE